MNPVLSACDTPGRGVRRRGITAVQRLKTANEDFEHRKPVDANHSAAGPQGSPRQDRQGQDRGPEGQPAAPWRMHPRVHHHSEEAELGASEGRPREADEPGRGHGLHSRRGPQPAGALDGAGARRPCEGPARCAVQDHPRFARHTGCQEPQAGSQPLWRQEGEELMPRKGPAPKRPLVNDPVYGSQLVTQLVNKVLLCGKKSLAERIVYGALEQARDKTGTDPVVTLKRAMDNVKPALEVRSRRVGGATYQVPVEVRPERSVTLALRWLVSFSKQRREKTMIERLANEILDASNGLGAAVKRREDTHKMAEANRAFAHYRW